MPDYPRIAYVVSHTHWDREWYLTFPRFRVMLHRALKGILGTLEDDDDFLHFVLDGQAVVVEDYLEVEPRDGAVIKHFVETGALSIGPWYVLPDEFLIGEETTIRNLVYGQAVASRFGPVAKVGYMPDSFGHISQLPQILRGAGIDSFIYTRGNGDEIDDLGLEYIWEAPNGDRVLAVNQSGGYCNAAALGLEELWHAHTRRRADPVLAVKKVQALFAEMAKRSNGDIWLLNNGCDHHPVQRAFGPIMDTLRQAFPKTEFRHASHAQFIGALKREGVARKAFEGELLGGKQHHILSGVWSARMPLKQENERCETWLAGVAEPLASYVHFAHGFPYRKGVFDDAWKTLLKNQPHDSICGCSTDEVHRDMEPRFRHVRETAEQLIVENLQSLVPTFGRTPDEDGDTVLAVFNPLPEHRTAVIERLVVLEPPGVDPANLRILDEQQSELPFEIVEIDRVERFWGVDYRLMLDIESQRECFESYRKSHGTRMWKTEDEKDEADTMVRVRFLAPVPALGHALFRISSEPGRRGWPEIEMPVFVGSRTIENGLVRVTMNDDGTFDLESLATGVVRKGLGRLEDVADIGDEYDFSPAEADAEPIRLDHFDGTPRMLDPGGLRGRLEMTGTARLPARITDDRTRRSGHTVDCPVTIRVGLDANSPRVDLEILFENQAEDHRLQVVFPSGVDSDSVTSHGHFDVLDRDLIRPLGADWVQPPPDAFPQGDVSWVQDERHGLAVLNEGLPELGCTRASDGTLDLRVTLLRSVGWLSRDDFPTRRNQNAGPTIATPEAQCKGPHRYRLAVLPFTRSPFDKDLPVTIPGTVLGAAKRWRIPLPCVQGVGGRAIGMGPFFLVSWPIEMTAVKRHEERDTLVVRMWNPRPDEIQAEVTSYWSPIEAAWRVNLLEERGTPIHRADDFAVTLPLKGREIATVELQLRRRQ